MTTMLEHVTRAIHTAGYEATGQVKPFEELPPYLQEVTRVMARAAIEAMREPTEEMVRMGMTALPNSTPGRHQKTGWVWDAMIEAALGEQS